MPIMIHGKPYKTVSERVTEFREDHKQSYGISSEILHNDKSVLIKATITNDQGFVVATGYAEEIKGSGINKNSAIENCETSAIGRALASFGYAGSEYASAQEMVDVYVQETKEKAVAFYKAMADAIRENWASVAEIKRAIAEGDTEYARECFNELSEEDQQAIWVAPTKGGIFTVEERKAIKGD